MVVRDVVGVDPGSGQASINSARKCMQILWSSMQAGRAGHYHTDGRIDGPVRELVVCRAFTQETDRTRKTCYQPVRQGRCDHTRCWSPDSATDVRFA